MCTSIAVYKAKPIYAMNFDFFEVESKIKISNSGSVPAFFYKIKQGEEFLETASKRNDVTKIKNNFLIMTNFPVGQFKNVDYKAVS